MLYKICPLPVMRSLYFSLFNSHLSYGLVAWGNANKIDIKRITSLQKKAIKAIYKHADSEILPTSKILRELKILNVKD